MITKTKAMNLLGKLHGITKVSGQCYVVLHGIRGTSIGTDKIEKGS